MRSMLDVPFFALGEEKGTTMTVLRTEKLPLPLRSATGFDRLDSCPSLFGWPYAHGQLFLRHLTQTGLNSSHFHTSVFVVRQNQSFPSSYRHTLTFFALHVRQPDFVFLCTLRFL